MSNLQDDFRAAAEEYANRRAAEKERDSNPHSARVNAAEQFAEHIEQALAEQHANGTRLTINNL